MAVITERVGKVSYGFTHQRCSPPIMGVLLLLLAVVASSCNEIPAELITIDDQFDQTIVIIGNVATGEPTVMEILPGRTGVDRSACVDPDLEARLESGAVVAFRAGPFCQGDPVWVITRVEVDAAE